MTAMTVLGGQPDHQHSEEDDGTINEDEDMEEGEIVDDDEPEPDPEPDAAAPKSEESPKAEKESKQAEEGEAAEGGQDEENVSPKEKIRERDREHKKRKKKRKHHEDGSDSEGQEKTRKKHKKHSHREDEESRHRSRRTTSRRKVSPVIGERSPSDRRRLSRSPQRFGEYSDDDYLWMLKEAKEEQKKRGKENTNSEEDRPPPRNFRRFMCKYFAKYGNCTKGDHCEFYHQVPNRDRPKKPMLCKYYISGTCRRDKDCNYMHKEFPCKFFHRGMTCYANEKCRFSHEPLTDETKSILERITQSHDDDYDRRDRRGRGNRNDRMNDDNRGEGSMTPPYGDKEGLPEVKDDENSEKDGESLEERKAQLVIPPPVEIDRSKPHVDISDIPIRDLDDQTVPKDRRARIGVGWIVKILSECPGEKLYPEYHEQPQWNPLPRWDENRRPRQRYWDDNFESYSQEYSEEYGGNFGPMPDDYTSDRPPEEFDNFPENENMNNFPNQRFPPDGPRNFQGNFPPNEQGNFGGPPCGFQNDGPNNFPSGPRGFPNNCPPGMGGFPNNGPNNFSGPGGFPNDGNYHNNGGPPGNFSGNFAQGGFNNNGPGDFGPPGQFPGNFQNFPGNNFPPSGPDFSGPPPNFLNNADNFSGPSEMDRPYPEEPSNARNLPVVDKPENVPTDDTVQCEATIEPQIDAGNIDEPVKPTSPKLDLSVPELPDLTPANIQKETSLDDPGNPPSLEMQTLDSPSDQPLTIDLAEMPDIQPEQPSERVIQSDPVDFPEESAVSDDFLPVIPEDVAADILNNLPDGIADAFSESPLPTVSELSIDSKDELQNSNDDLFDHLFMPGGLDENDDNRLLIDEEDLNDLSPTSQKKRQSSQEKINPPQPEEDTSQSTQSDKASDSQLSIPNHLPRKQQALFRRIQQHQKEASSQDESSQPKDDEASANSLKDWLTWDSSDEEDDTEKLKSNEKKEEKTVKEDALVPGVNDEDLTQQPLHAILQSLQKASSNTSNTAASPLSALLSVVGVTTPSTMSSQSPTSTTGGSASNSENSGEPTTGQKSILSDIAKMLQICSTQAKSLAGSRDKMEWKPQTISSSQEADSPKTSRSRRSSNETHLEINAKLNSESIPYQLRTVSVPDKLLSWMPVIDASRRDPRLQNDPRLKRYLDDPSLLPCTIMSPDHKEQSLTPPRIIPKDDTDIRQFPMFGAPEVPEPPPAPTVPTDPRRARQRPSLATAPVLTPPNLPPPPPMMHPMVFVPPPMAMPMSPMHPMPLMGPPIRPPKPGLLPTPNMPPLYPYNIDQHPPCPPMLPSQDIDLRTPYPMDCQPIPPPNWQDVDLRIGPPPPMHIPPQPLPLLQDSDERMMKPPPPPPAPPVAPEKNERKRSNSTKPSEKSSRTSSRTRNRTEKKPTKSEEPTPPAKPETKAAPVSRKSTLEYASPLGYGDTTSSSDSSIYNRRPQLRAVPITTTPKPTAKPTPVMNKEPEKVPTPPPIVQPMETNEEIPDTHVPNLKEVFKTIDPTASPFC